MKFKNDIIELIRKRYSCRNFQVRQIDRSTREELEKACRSINKGLFGEEISLFFIDRTENMASVKYEGGFEYIMNPGYFVAGKIQSSKFTYESCGYILEQLVLKATDMNMGTCWIGYFNPEFFHEVKLSANEVFPAIIILGHPSEKKALIDILNRKLYSRADNRRKWDRLFFIKDFNNPLTRDDAGKYSEPLEMLRLAPSSGNTQPWRIVKDSDSNIFHFYKQVISFHYELKKLHNIDIGIAMCHFDMVAGNHNLHGSWKELNPGIKTPANTEYIISWKGDSALND
ncbi:MAG: nitroreductase family protein [Bacteroidales bacterium]|nr:MAG: nitroreductase family protein [Bacteroidales bacterium]